MVKIPGEEIANPHGGFSVDLPGTESVAGEPGDEYKTTEYVRKPFSEEFRYGMNGSIYSTLY